MKRITLAIVMLPVFVAGAQVPDPPRPPRPPRAVAPLPPLPPLEPMPPIAWDFPFDNPLGWNLRMGEIEDRARAAQDRVAEAQDRIQQRVEESQFRLQDRLAEAQFRLKEGIDVRIQDRLDDARLRLQEAWSEDDRNAFVGRVAPFDALTPMVFPNIAFDLRSGSSSSSWSSSSSPAAADWSGLIPSRLDGTFLNSRPREPWAKDDPADSIYRAAREALNRGEYRRAAELFGEINQKYPKSAYASECGYWEAFSRYRIGTTDELKAAAHVLETLSARAAPMSRETDVAGLRSRINGALAVRGDQQAEREVQRDAAKAGDTTCDKEDLMVRVEALNALGQMDPAAAAPILRRVLERKDECSVELRRRAVMLLGRRADSTSVNALIFVAKNDVNPNVRSEAIGWLARQSGDNVIAALEDIMRTSDDEQVQRYAVRALTTSDNPRARVGMRALIERKDASERLRLEAISSYERDRSTTEDAAYLRSLYPKLESERLKSAVIGAVARIGGKDSEDWLIALVRNPNESSELRSAALQRVGRMNIPVADLAKMYDAGDSRTMREQLINVLGSRKEPEATDKLMEIAKTGTDPYMRRMAISTLSRKNDPRTMKLLMELIDK